MQVGNDLLLLPYGSRWRRQPVAAKVAVSGLLLVVAMAPGPWQVAAGVGVLASVLAVGLAGVRVWFWVRLLSGPLLFAVVSAGIAAWGGALRGESLVRTWGASAATLLLGVTTPVQDLVAWLQRRRGGRTIAELSLLAYRALAAVGQAGVAMVRAVRARRLGRGWRTAPRLYGAFSGALAIRSLERARRAESGLAVRRLGGRIRLLDAEWHA